MPIIRKIIDVGKTSKGVILPKSWLEYYEKEVGRRIDSVAIQVDRVLIIEPLFREGDKQNRRTGGPQEAKPPTEEL